MLMSVGWSSVGGGGGGGGGGGCADILWNRVYQLIIFCRALPPPLKRRMASLLTKRDNYLRTL